MNKVKPREVKNYKMCIAKMYSQIYIKLFHEANCIQPFIIPCKFYVFSFLLSTNYIILGVETVSYLFHVFTSLHYQLSSNK